MSATSIGASPLHADIACFGRSQPGHDNRHRRLSGLRPWTRNSGLDKICRIGLVPAVAGWNADDLLDAVVLLARRRSRQSGCKASGKARKKRWGKESLLYAHSARLYRVKPKREPAWLRLSFPQRFSLAFLGQKLHTSRNPSASGGGCRFIPTA